MPEHYHAFDTFFQTESMRANHVIDIKLSPIEIPKFSGNHAAWPAFKELFTRVIGQRVSLTGAQKLL